MTDKLTTKPSSNYVLILIFNTDLCQSNGKAEVTNRIILQNLRMKLDKSKDKWTAELTRNIMGLPYDSSNTNQRDSFQPCIRYWNYDPSQNRTSNFEVEHFDESSNLARLRANLDLLEETYNQAHLWWWHIGNQLPDITILAWSQRSSIQKTVLWWAEISNQ